MDEKYSNAREQFYAAIRILATSNASIQTRVIEATPHILSITIDEFKSDVELKLKFARILDILAVDQNEVSFVAIETVAHMTDLEAERVAILICDFFYDL
jgi:hypothetical protein